MKTNKELNKEHAGRELLNVRPKRAAYDFAPLTAVIRTWVLGK